MKKSRIALIDILRGFALLLIVLIHFAEHFELYKATQFHYFFTEAQDKKTMFWVLQFIRGNAYSIFALLFGLSFYIQMQNKAEKGIDYRKGFAWRMLLLLVIGFFNSLIYRGDILHMYALFALPVILIYPLKSKRLFIIAILLLVQFPLIYTIIHTYADANYKPAAGYTYWQEGNNISAVGSFWEVIKFNFYKGRHTAWIWTIDVGRHLQIWSLFIFGILLGRIGLFQNSRQYQHVFIKALLIALPITIGLALLSECTIKDLDLVWHQKRNLRRLIDSWKNIFGTASYISIITLLFHMRSQALIFRLLQAYGKLSLTNYMVQGAIGVTLFYGFGFGLWKHLGDTLSLLLGGVFFFLQAYICLIWNKYFYYGPMEWIWRCFSDFNFKTSIKK